MSKRVLDRSFLAVCLATSMLLTLACTRTATTNRKITKTTSQAHSGDPVVGERIADAVAIEGKLWLLSRLSSANDLAGGLISLDLVSLERRVLFPNGVFSIVKEGQELWVMRRPSPQSGGVLVSRWRADEFWDLPSMEISSDDEPIALFIHDGSPVVLTKQSVQRFASGMGETWQGTKLDSQLRGGVQVSVAAPRGGDVAYVGLNVGEWGGGLQQVNLRDGSVHNIERRDSSNLCAGPLNKDCDPVTGLIEDPENAQCVLASVGLVHLGFSEGRILRICGQRVEILVEFPFKHKESLSLKQTEAFYGLRSAGGGNYWGITWRALYKFQPDGKTYETYERPKAQNVAGILMSREIPGVVIICTDVNWAVSTSGYTPLVVPLEAVSSKN